MKLIQRFLSLFKRKGQTGMCIATCCGHPTTMTGEVHAFGENTTTTMPRNAEGATDWCIQCIEKMAVQCAWCAKAIFIGNPVTLYIPKKDFVPPEHVVIYAENPLQLVGCLRMTCADTGADRAGFWLPNSDGKGHVHRMASPLELAMTTGDTVIVSDVGDIREANKLQAKLAS